MRYPGVLACMAMGYAGALHAAEPPSFADFDANKDGVLDPAEYQVADDGLYARDDPASNARRTALLLEPPDENDQRSVRVLEDKANVAGLLCDTERFFFVRAAIQGVPLAICAPSGKGLGFSAEDNRETGVRSLSLDGGLGLRLPMSERTDAARFGMLAFIEGHSLTYSSADDGNEGQLRAGIQAEIDTVLRAGTTGTYWKFTAAPYAMTDANLEAEGLGLTASITPTVPDWRLNARQVSQKYWFTARLTFDYLDVREGGVSGLADSTEYGWAEAVLGYQFLEPGDRNKNRNGYKLGLVGTYARDFLNDEDYSHISASWNIFLDVDKRTSLKLEYKRGETRQSPQFQDVASVGLALRF